MTTDTSLDDFIAQLFSREPQPPCSISVCLSENATNEHDVFRSLGQILTHGIVYLYSENVNLQAMSQTDIKKLQEYFQSFGWSFIILKNDNDISQHPRALKYKLRIPLYRAPTTTYVDVIFEPFYITSDCRY